MIDENKLKKILISKGKDKIRLSTVINEIELMKKFDVDFIGNWRLAEDTPEENGGYICTLAGDMVGSEESFVGMSWYENGEWDDVEDVIAWMPLPEPYEGERDEEE